MGSLIFPGKLGVYYLTWVYEHVLNQVYSSKPHVLISLNMQWFKS